MALFNHNFVHWTNMCVCKYFSLNWQLEIYASTTFIFGCVCWLHDAHENCKVLTQYSGTLGRSCVTQGSSVYWLLEYWENSKVQFRFLSREDKASMCSNLLCLFNNLRFSFYICSFNIQSVNSFGLQLESLISFNWQSPSFTTTTGAN